MGSTSFWQAELQAQGHSPIRMEPLSGEQETEIAIIGAGITGTALALWLSRAGRQVTVVESRQVAAGASGRNAGFLGCSTGEPYAKVIREHGHDYARRLWLFHVHNQQRAEQLIDEMKALNWTCGFQRRGSLMLAASEREWQNMQESTALLNADGWSTEVLQPDRLPARIRHAYYGGIYSPRDAEVQPARFVTGVALLAQQTGAVFHGQSPVQHIQIASDHVTLETPGGSLRAQTLVLATNAWLPEIGSQIGATWLADCIAPTRGQVIATEPVAERIFTCLCHGDEGYQYWRQLDDGRLVIGGWRNHSFETEAQVSEAVGTEVQQHLDRFVHETLGLPEVRIEKRWAGVMAFSKDGLPLVGRLPGVEHCYLAGGYTGHGNASALQATYMLSQEIQGRSHPDSDLFAPTRFLG